VRADAAAFATELPQDGIAELAWSPCGSWLAYSFAVSSAQRVIKLLDVRSGAAAAVTAAVAADRCPAFDPEGRYLYFLSSRELEPAYDEHVPVGLSLAHGVQVPMLTLQSIESISINSPRRALGLRLC
jgi:tricorn protease-like protein